MNRMNQKSKLKNSQKEIKEERIMLKVIERVDIQKCKEAK